MYQLVQGLTMQTPITSSRYILATEVFWNRRPPAQKRGPRLRAQIEATVYFAKLHFWSLIVVQTHEFPSFKVKSTCVAYVYTKCPLHNATRINRRLPEGQSSAAKRNGTLCISFWYTLQREC